jgi:1-acyl-sn-glycerol-3-phosphate acyltransferase
LTNCGPSSTPAGTQVHDRSMSAVVPSAEAEERSQDPKRPGGGRAGALIRTIWGVGADAAMVLYTLVLGVVVILLAFIRPRTADWMALLWCRLILWTSGVRVDAVGKDNLPNEASYILVANHQSYFDVFGLVSVLGEPPRFVTKKELQRIPVFGQALRALGQIVIDRGDPEGAKRAIDAAARELPGGVKVCFFAEGTRSPDGRIGPFKKGAVALGLQTALPLVPVSISGTRKLMPKGSFLIRPGGRIRIVFGKPVVTRGVPFEERDALTAQLRDFVVREFDPSF